MQEDSDRCSPSGPRCVQSRTAGNIEDFGLKLVFQLFGTFLGAGKLRTDRPNELSKSAAACIRAACFASGFDLLVGSHVGLRRLRVQLGSGNLPLVPLGESLVHRPTVQHPAGPSTGVTLLGNRALQICRFGAAVEPGGFVSRHTRRGRESTRSPRCPKFSL